MYKAQANTAGYQNAEMPLAENNNFKFSRIFNGVSSVTKALVTAYNRRRTTATQHGLSDHVLRDIGVKRSEIANLVRDDIN